MINGGRKSNQGTVSRSQVCCHTHNVKLSKNYDFNESSKTNLFELVADERECLEDGFCVPGHRHDSLRAAPVADVDLRSTLK